MVIVMGRETKFKERRDFCLLEGWEKIDTAEIPERPF